MVSPGELAALDLLLWQRTGQRAAAALGCNQSTVSRRLARTIETFGLRLSRSQGDWQVQGDGCLLLAMERELHQLHRLLLQAALRLEISPLMARLLCGARPPGWLLGPMDHIGLLRPLQLLSERVIDAWIYDSSLDIQHGGDLGDLLLLPLFRYPLTLLVDRRHPLAGASAVTPADLARFPTIALPRDLFPHTAPAIAAILAPELTVQARRYDPADWEGRTADAATLAYGTPFNRQAHPQLQVVAADPLLHNGAVLVCRRDVAVHGPLHQLQAALEARLSKLAPELEPLGLQR